MPVVVSPMREEDIDGGIRTIQEAFANDPYNLWIFNDRSKASCIDLNRNRVSLRIRCLWGLRNALFHVAKEEGSDKVLGIAMWMPPRATNKPLTWGEWFWNSFEDWRLWGNQVAMNLQYGRGGLNVKRYYIWKARQAEAHREVWTDPKGYYFLNIISVLPEAQGKGVGRALFNEVTKKADAEGIKCYLESSRDEPNTKIYEAMGFKFVRGMDCDDDGEVCKLYCMVREPKVIA
ncbi:hypothetical protein VE04_07116 [Pseudogymnoascus sp. 24MN13]|nr:hypothetical protein VE04_07116 [Pseudogymnoascus sp. 24MN13]